MALSELHLALIGAGVVAVLMVLAYNFWQDRKHRKTAERIFGGDASRVHAGGAESMPGDTGARQEPRIASEPETGAAPVEEVEEQQAPLTAATAADVVSDAAPADSAPDDIADCTLRFSATTPISARLVQSIRRNWTLNPERPLVWTARDGTTGNWERIPEDDEGSYCEWAASLQLVDRRGPVSEGELAAFCASVEALARQTGATLETLPDTEELAAHAGALDQFCASVDIQFVLHVVEAGGGTFPGTKLRGLAEAAGMALEDDGLFHARDLIGGEEFSLGNLGPERFDAESLRNLATHGLTFSIDVPRVSDGKAAFERMLGTARQVAGALGGVLVDAQRAPLSDAMIAAIRAKTVELQQRMRDGGIDPGGRRALRLFS